MENGIISAEAFPTLWGMLSDDQKAEVLLLNAVAKRNNEQTIIAGGEPPAGITEG